MPDEKKIPSLGDYLNLRLFNLDESTSPTQKEILNQFYKDRPAVYFDTWRETQLKQKKPAEIKDFRESKEYITFSQQLHNIATAINKAFLKRQNKELSPLKRPLALADLKPVEDLAGRFLNPDLVSDVRINGQRSAAELIYTIGLSYLEMLLYKINTAPFHIVSATLKNLLTKEKGQRISNLSVCLGGTLQHLQDAVEGLTEIGTLDHALLTVMRQFAYEFMQQFSESISVGNEIHLNATLVNYYYEKKGLKSHEHKKIEDPMAYRPTTDGTVLDEFKTARIYFTEEEADDFVASLRPIAIIQAVIEKVVFRISQDMHAQSSYSSAKLFLSKLIKGFAPACEDQYDLAEWLCYFFGFYKIVKIEQTKSPILNDLQVQEILDHGCSAALTQLKSEHYIEDLIALCQALSNYPNVDRTHYSERVLKIYDYLKITLLDTRIVKNLNPTHDTQDIDIFYYLHQALLNELTKASSLYPQTTMLTESEKIKKRQQLASAAIKNLSKYSKIPNPTERETKKSSYKTYFGTMKVRRNTDELTLDDKKYISLDQMMTDEKKSHHAPIKSSQQLDQELYSFVFFLMIKGGHLRPELFTKIHATKKTIYYLVPGFLSLSWVKHLDVKEKESCSLLLNYCQQLAFKDACDFFHELALSCKDVYYFDELEKILNLIKKKPGAHFSYLSFFSAELSVNILARFAFKNEAGAKESLCKKLKIKPKSSYNKISANDILALLFDKEHFNLIIQIESRYLLQVTWNLSLFLACFAIGRRDFSGLRLTNIDFSGQHLAGVCFKNAILQNINFHNVTWGNTKWPDFTGTTLKNVLFFKSTLRSLLVTDKQNTFLSEFLNNKNVTLDQATFYFLYRMGARHFNGLILDGIDFRQIIYLEHDYFYFKGSSMKWARFDNMSLVFFDFSDANLQGANFSLANLELQRSSRVSLDHTVYTTLFQGANLQNANLSHIQGNPFFRNTRMDAIAVRHFLNNRFDPVRNFKGIEFVGTDIMTVDFGQSILNKKQIQALYDQGRRNFQFLILDDQKLNGLKVPNANFSYASFKGTDFSGSDLTNVLFTHARFFKGTRKRANFQGTIYAPLVEDEDGYIYLRHQQGSPIQTLKKLLSEEQSLHNRCFSGLFAKRSHVIAINDLLHKLCLKPDVSSMQDVYNQLSPEQKQMLQRKKGRFFSIITFCTKLELITRNGVQNQQESLRPS